MSGTQQNARAIVRRRLPSVPYQAGVRNTVSIDRDGIMSMLVVRVSFTVTNGGTGPATPFTFALARLIRRLEIVINGQDTIVSLPGAHIASRAQVEFGVRPLGMEATVVLTASAVTTYDVFFPIPLFLPRAVRPDDASLDLRRVDQAIVAITWGDASDLFTTVNAAAVSAVTCELEGHYYVNPMKEERFLVRALDVQEVPNAASNANLGILLDRGSDLFWRSFHMLTTRNNVIPTSPLILTGDVRLTAGAFSYLSRTAPQLLAQPMRDYSIPQSEYPAAERAYRIDLAYHQQSTTLINAGQLSGDLYLTVGTTYTSGTEIISISRECIRPLRIG